MATATPDQELAAFFRRVKGEAPNCTFVSVAPDKTRTASHIATWITKEAEWEGHIIPATSNTAEASKKKAAHKAAALLAVQQLRSHPAWKVIIVADKSDGSVLSVIQAMLSEEEVRRNVEVEAEVLMAQRFRGGWLPLPPLLCTSRRSLLAAWARKTLPSSTIAHPAVMLTTVQEMVCAEATDSDYDALASSIEVDIASRCVRRKQPIQRQGYSWSAAAMEASLSHMGSHMYSSVVVPADWGQAAREVTIDGSKDYLAQLAAALNGTAGRLWSWGIANRNFAVYAVPDGCAPQQQAVVPPEDPSDSIFFEKELRVKLGYPPAGTASGTVSSPPKPTLQQAAACITGADGKGGVPLTVGVGGGSQDTTGGGISNEGSRPGAADDVIGQAAARTNPWPTAAAVHPTMYSLLPASDAASAPAGSSEVGSHQCCLDWNERAGWITGRAVRGDVVLSRIRPRPWVAEVGGHRRAHPLMRTGQYPLSALLAAADSAAPSAMFARGIGAPLLGRLPTQYLSLESWAGPPPTFLLSEICTDGVCGVQQRPVYGVPGAEHLTSREGGSCTSPRRKCPRLAHGTTQDDEPPDSVAECAVPLLCEPEPLLASSDICRGEAEAKEQAALYALAALEQQHSRVWAVATAPPAHASSPDHLPQNGNLHVTSGVQHLSALPGSLPAADLLTAAGSGQLGKCATSSAEDTTGSTAPPAQPTSKGSAAPGWLSDALSLNDPMETGSSPAAAHCVGKVEILKAGLQGALRASHGLKVKVSYTVTATLTADGGGSGTDGNSAEWLLEHHDNLSFIFGTGGVVAAVEVAAAAVAIGGVARCALPLHLLCGLPRPEETKVAAVLTLRLDSVTARTADVRQMHGRAFTPACSQQRHGFVEKALQAAGAARVADLGCGDCALILHLVESASADGSGCYTPALLPPAHCNGGSGGSLLSFKELIGVDISLTALVRGQKRLQVAAQASHNEGRSCPKLSLIQDSICKSTWGTLTDVDAAVAVEVIEHLDPPQVDALAGSILGALRPATAIITTPNFEYNIVLQSVFPATAAVSVQLSVAEEVSHRSLGTGTISLRNKDHRFEWTREQFQEWASAAARQFGYSVVFHGIGRVTEAALANSPAHIQQAESSLGCSTQAAVFTLQR